jgi:regulator of sigma E protease
VQKKGEEESVDVSLTPRLPEVLATENFFEGVLAADAVGIAYFIEHTVSGVEGPAAAAGIKSGDVLKAAEFIAADKQKAEQEAKYIGKAKVELKELVPWSTVMKRLARSLPDTKVKLTVERDGETKEFTVTPEDSAVFHTVERGIMLTTRSEMLTADNPWHAFKLGLRNTWESLTRVISFLGQLVTGGISLTGIGGPLTIIDAAANEASIGITSLLLFLTLLSANLAIINFLPIPVLDGGHMMFLAYEAIRGKPADEKWMIALTYAGLLFVLGIMVVAISLDIYTRIP